MSSDSDLAEPMRVLIQEFQRTVGLVATTKQPSNVLLGTGPKIVRELREGVLGAAQLPARLQVEHGTVSKPNSWWKAEAPDESGASRPVAEASGGVG